MGVTELKELDSIFKLQDVMMGLPKIDLAVEHIFGHDVYARKMTIKKGTVIVGKMHKTANINVMLSGDLTVVDSFGSNRVSSPCIFVSPPKVKRAAYAHEDTIWICFHASKTKDLKAIERRVIEKDEGDIMLRNQIEKIKAEL